MSRDPAVEKGTEAAVEKVLDALDWQALAELYCEGGGEAFWDEHREPVVHHGFSWAAALKHRLDPDTPVAAAAEQHPGRGRSLYVGAGVAEIPPMVFEHLEMGREVHGVTLREPECAVINRAMQAADLPIRFHPGEVGDWLAAPTQRGMCFDHIACVSVCSDPETYPLISGLAYGALHPAQCNPAGFQQEHERLARLTGNLLSALDIADSAWITTTDEELPWFAMVAAERDRLVQLDEERIPTAVVGDAICFLHFDPRRQR